MNNQTADYISLKPLADRFRKVAESINDDEIKDIIKSKIEEKVEESTLWIRCLFVYDFRRVV